jgi:hypothetical protein
VKAALDAVIGAFQAGVAAVKDWWGVRISFVANDKQDHELYFEGSGSTATLVLSSNKPKKLADRIQSRINTLRRKKPIPIAAIDALNTANNQLQDLYKYVAAEELKTSATPEGTGTAGIREEIEKRLEVLRPLLVTGTIIEADDALPLTNLTYQMDGNKAGSVTADPLTKNQGNTVGQPAPGSSASPPGWSLAQMWNATKTPLIFNRVHLVHYQFHGPATEWNLVPAEIGVNVQFMTIFENQIKADWATREMKLTVQAHYPSDQSSITFTRGEDVEEAKVSDFPSGFTVTLQRWNPDTEEFEYLHKETPIGGTRPPQSGSLDDAGVTVERLKSNIDRYIASVGRNDQILTWSQYRDSSINIDVRKRLGTELVDQLRQFYDDKVRQRSASVR